jgi:hypothetical protein
VFEGPINETFYEIVFYGGRSKVKTSEYQKKIKALFPEYEIDVFETDQTKERKNYLKGQLSENLKKELEPVLHKKPEISDIELRKHLNNVFPQENEYKSLTEGIIIELFDISGRDCIKLDCEKLKQQILPMIKWTVPVKQSNNNDKGNLKINVSSKVPREGFYDEELLLDSGDNIKLDEEEL